METRKTTKPYPAELRERAVRMVREHEARARLAVGGDPLDRGEGRLHGRDAAAAGCGRPSVTGARGAGLTSDERDAAEGAGAGEPRAAPGQRDPAQGISAYFAAGGARPPVQAMIAFIDDHRAVHGVEPICRELPIAPSTYHAHAARRADPSKAPAARAPRRRPSRPDPAGLGGELPGLRRAQGLAAARPRRDRASRAARSPV